MPVTSDPSETATAGAQGADPGGRSRRADARRNHELLVEAARRVFADAGPGAPMEAVARQAGVGVGTLYRHFPTRIDLVEAVYRSDVDELVASAEKAVHEHDPWDAVSSFLEAFVRYAQAKRSLLSALHDAFEKRPDLRLASRERIDYAFNLVIARGQEAGVVRADVDGADVMALVVPVCSASGVSDDQATRLMRMVLDGLRPPGA
jgi:AcrR family transcriptional regulator